jgi:AmiR/NasT family two-component response regulator
VTDESVPTRPARRVVVAEDEALIRLDVVEMLRDGGFEVVGEAGDGEHAVRLAEEHRPDLVVMDVKMPVLDGISAAERIVRARIAPVVLLTAFSQRELVERARDAGAMAYVVKPFAAADLLPALEIAVSRHQEIVALEAEVADLADRFETRKLVDRAKGLLQSKFGMSEPDAFRWIQKTSMDKRLTMREVATAVVNSSASASGTAAVRTPTAPTPTPPTPSPSPSPSPSPTPGSSARPGLPPAPPQPSDPAITAPSSEDFPSTPPEPSSR